MPLSCDFSQLEAKLDSLAKKVSNNVTKTALMAGGEIILEKQKEIVPEDTGQLKHSLAVGKLTGTGAKRKILVGIDPGKYEQCRYGFFLEYGTRKMVGRHWMKNAFLNSVGEADLAIRKTLAAELENL